MALTEPVGTWRGMTEEELLRLPDDGRKYELVDGELKEVPGGVQQDVIGVNLIALLRPHAKGRGYLCGAQAGFRMTEGNIRAPDVSFTRRERFPGGRPPVGFADAAPDLAVEIISPYEDREDIARKVREYLAAGAQQVWQLFPERRELRLFDAADAGDASTLLAADEEITGGELLPEFRCRVSELFELE